jgi:hypothetical protein
MSRGPGRWQSKILATLERHSAFYERDLLGIKPSRSEQSALGRAIRELHDAHKIGLARWWGRNPAGGRLVIYRVDTLAPHPSKIARLVSPERSFQN